VDIAGKTLRLCIDNGIYDAKDFEAVLDMFLNQKRANGTSMQDMKKVSLSINQKIVEITPNTSNIMDYEKIMKN